MTERAAASAGDDAVWRRWWIVGLAGALWMLLGLLLFANAFFGGVPIRPGWLAVPLVLDAVVSVVAVFGRAGRGVASA